MMRMSASSGRIREWSCPVRTQAGRCSGMWKVPWLSGYSVAVLVVAVMLGPRWFGWFSWFRFLLSCLCLLGLLGKLG